MTKKRKVLEVGDGIFLRQYVPADAPVIFQLIDENREHLSQHGEDTARKYPTLESVADSIINPQNPRRLRFGIWDKDVFVGGINITPAENHTAVLGYWLGGQHQSKGYAGRSAWTLILSAFKAGKVQAIVAHVAKTNDRSIRLLERVGFIQTTENEETLIFTMERWLPIYLGGLTFCGPVRTKKKWREVLEIYKDRGGLEWLKKWKYSDEEPPKKYPDFGVQPRHTMLPTLGQWAERRGINLETD